MITEQQIQDIDQALNLDEPPNVSFLNEDGERLHMSVIDIDRGFRTFEGEFEGNYLTVDFDRVTDLQIAD